MRLYCVIISAVLIFMIFMFPFTEKMRERPVIQKIGYIPQQEVIRFGVADQKMATSAYLIMKVLTYFGGLAQNGTQQGTPDYFGMFKVLQASQKLDPYNIDGYYFLQSIIAWDALQVAAVNKILEDGLKYRDWDYMLPFFLAFNHSYFLHDYKVAAKYYQRAGELSGDSLFSSIAGRYLYESQQTDQAILFLKTMIITSKKDSVKKMLQQRLEALMAVRALELAVEAYKRKYLSAPESVNQLISKGIISALPIDPYGGSFFIDMAGTIRTTSNFYPQK